MELVTRKLTDLIPYAKNARFNDATIPDLVKSMEQTGYNSPIVVDENNEILAGHSRQKALMAMGEEEAQVILVTGLTEEQKRKFRLYDNKVGEKSQWDFDLLAEEIADLDFGGLTDSLDWGLDVPEIEPEEPDEEEAPVWKKNHASDKYSYYGETRERSFEISNFKWYDETRVEGKYNMPTNRPTQHVPKGLIGFDHMLPSQEFEKGVHFYLYDYMFERIWNSPFQYFEKLKRFDCCISPDFSLYTDMPIAMQIWNTFRNRLLTQMMQDYGIEVIPAIMWSTPESYEFCFDGMPKHSVLAVETVGCAKNKEDKKCWFDGMTAAMERLEPTGIILYGSDLGFDFGGIPVTKMKNTNGERMAKSAKEKKNK